MALPRIFGNDEIPKPPAFESDSKAIPVPPAATPHRASPRAIPQVPDFPAESPDDRIPVIVKLSAGALTDDPGVVQRLQETGMEIPENRVFEQLDRVSGTIGPEQLEALKAVPGVLDVSHPRNDYGFG